MKIAKQFALPAYLLATGLLATITMDIAAVTAIKSGIVKLGPYQIVPRLLGRWVGSFPSGKIFHTNILDTPPLPQEIPIGILSHYVIGLTLCSVFVLSSTKIFARRIDLWSAIIFGIATCIFPYFIMFPAMGFGVMGFKSFHESMLTFFSVVNHAAFGAGIFIWSNLLQKVLCPQSPSN